MHDQEKMIILGFHLKKCTADLNLINSLHICYSIDKKLHNIYNQSVKHITKMCITGDIIFI